MKNKYYERTETKKNGWKDGRKRKKDNLKKCLYKKGQKVGKFEENNIQEGMNEGKPKRKKWRE